VAKPQPMISRHDDMKHAIPVLVRADACQLETYARDTLCSLESAGSATRIAPVSVT
jgi:hypothetical protein